MAGSNTEAQTTVPDPTPSLVDLKSSMRAYLFTDKLRTCNKLSWDNTAPASLSRILDEIRVYKLDQLSGLGDAHCSEKAEILLHSIYDTHIESCLPLESYT